MRRSKLRQRGYTVVELLVGVCIFGIGVMGIIAMQKITSVSNRHAKNLAIATHIAQSWLEHLSVDSTRWTRLQTRTVNTVWLKDTPDVWTLPTFSLADDFGPAFDALGQPLPDATSVVFCTHIRLVELIQETSSPGNGLLRVDVRVFWPRDGEAVDPAYCTTAAPSDIGAAPQLYHFVYKSTAVRQMSN